MISRPAFEKEVEIRYKGVYDLDGIYKTIRGWFDNRRYDYMEKTHKDKATNPWGNEVEWEMNTELKVDGFIKYEIYVRTKFFDVKEYDAEIHGHKHRLTNGKFWIEITGNVVFDYNKHFETPFTAKLLDLLVNHIFKRYYAVNHIEKLYKSLFDLQTEIKKFMKMETAYNAYPPNVRQA